MIQKYTKLCKLHDLWKIFRENYQKIYANIHAEVDFCVDSVGHYTLTIYNITYDSGVIIVCEIGSIYNKNMSTLPNALGTVGLDVVSRKDVMSGIPSGSVQGYYSLIQRKRFSTGSDTLLF